MARINNMQLSSLSQDSTKFHINPAYLTARDLKTFVDSIEHLARVKRAQQERFLMRKTRRIEITDFTNVLDLLESNEYTPEYAYPISSSYSSGIENDNESNEYCSIRSNCCNNSPHNSCCYESVSIQKQPIQHIAPIGRTTSSSSISDCAESGIFSIGSDQPFLEKNKVKLVRPCAEVVTKSKHKLVQKQKKSMEIKQQARNQQQLLNSDIESASSFDGQLSPSPQETKVERLDRMVDEVASHQYASISTITKKKKNKTKLWLLNRFRFC